MTKHYEAHCFTDTAQRDLESRCSGHGIPIARISEGIYRVKVNSYKAALWEFACSWFRNDDDIELYLDLT